MSSCRGIIYEYEDGGVYCGEWEKDSSHGHGCGTGPGGRGRFEGLWAEGGQVSGVYTWPHSGMRYMGTWKDNKRHGHGKEIREDGTEYCGEYVRGARGPYGVMKLPNSVFRGSWRNGKQDGEGEEVYLDGGCYRGQYKNGMRYGCGTRTSAAYEIRDKDSSLSQDQTTIKHQKPLSSFITPFKRTSITSSPSYNMLSSLSSNATTMDRSRMTEPESQVSGKGENIQIYEGEWKDDKRHGYGVIKCIGSYTYYGQWSNNKQTGYGVMVYDNKIKREGQWQNGQLIVVLKRKKLQLKTHQLETKVQTAHTQAIQAAESARNKALLAKSRANTAMKKAKAAQKYVMEAEKNAQTAREKAELFKNAPRISEGLKSPLLDVVSFTPPMSRPSSSRSSDSPSLRYSSKASRNVISEAPSYEYIQSNDSSVAGSDLEDFSDGEENSVDGLANIRRGFFKKKGSRDSSKGSYGSMEDEMLAIKRREFAELDSNTDMQFASSSSYEGSASPMFNRKMSEGSNVVKGKKQMAHRGSYPDSLVEEEEMDGVEGGDSLRRRQKRDKTTGELEHYATDEEPEDHLLQNLKRKGSQPKPHPLEAKNSAMEILINNLNQMANWNKMVAYINFFLLIFLLLLILVVVICLNYYQLSSYYHNHSPDEQGPATGFSPIA